MDVGGVERALLGLLSSFDPQQVELHVGLLQKKGDFLPLLPEGVAVHTCFQGAWETVNRPPLATARELFRRGKRFEAFVRVCCYAVYKITGDHSLFYTYVLRHEPLLEETFDEAHAFAGPASMLDFYICRKIRARKRYGWIHFDVRESSLNRVMTRRFFRCYEKVYVVSEEAKRHFDALFPRLAGRTEVRYHLLSADAIRAQAETGPTFDDGFRGKRILTVGRLSKEKGQEVTVEVLRRLLDRGCDVKWYYVGSGPMQARCEALAEACGVKERTVFLGTQTNPYGYMRDCDVYVQPSRHEGYCITLAEARCFSVPIVATCFAGAEEQLAARPQSLVTGMSAEALAGGIETFL